jgi:hypothetical protein
MMRSNKEDQNLEFLTTFISLNKTGNDLIGNLFQNYNYNLFNLYSILKLYQHTFGK